METGIGNFSIDNCEDLEEAKASGNEAKVRELTQALETKQAWFDQISSSLS